MILMELSIPLEGRRTFINMARVEIIHPIYVGEDESGCTIFFAGEGDKTSIEVRENVGDIIARMPRDYVFKAPRNPAPAMHDAHHLGG